MRIHRKMVTGFVIVSLLVGFVGLIGLYANSITIESFESGGEHFTSIVMASVEVSSYAKRAEGHTMLFLTLNDSADADKFSQRIASLRNYTSIIDQKASNPEARKILEQIKGSTENLESVGKSLIEAYRRESAGGFNFSRHSDEIRNLNKFSSEIREAGVKLAELEIRLKAEHEATTKEAAAALYSIIFAFVIIAFITSVVLGNLIARKISGPIKRLSEAASEIGGGKFDLEVRAESKDEIGELAESFNRRVSDIKKSKEEMHQHEIEKNVSLRTADLGEKMKEIETSRTAILNMMEDSEDVNKQLIKAQEDLKRAMDELKKTDVKKDEFISVTAHEFKTPLTAIHGFAELLQDKKIDVKSTKKYLNIIKEETERLARLVSEILNLSRIDLGTLKITYEELDLYKLVETIRSEADIKIKSRGLKSGYELEKKLPKIESDREKLTEILLNLLDNAAKYTNKGSITLKISRENDSIHFTVKDTGIGIPEESKPKMFERFYQVDSSNTRKVGGTGLGLALSKEYVATMGGKMWFVSDAGKGSEFHFNLPIRAPKKEKAEAPGKEKYEGKSALFRK
jgi:signal transduction histidine kinase